MSSFKLQPCCVLSVEPAQHGRSDRDPRDMGEIERRAFFVPPSESLETYTNL